ncbi:type I DNA topoisomerase [Candidatus Saccharibacteria bacterium]|nr:type I DNA topoisomerase [Candidatus Saccharibacteria bacterium]
MPKNLVIVESPAKAKTVARYLGKDFRVMSSFGHIRDLPKKDIGVNIEKNFEPTYQVPPDKEKIAKELKAAAKGSVVWLASDEDREGEAIAWHVCALLNLSPEKTNRIVFHEITEPAITAAIKAPRNIDRRLVDAQQARRVLDRLVGYELSPVLWKKVRSGLSAGRVQSVAVRLIVEREREIKDFQPESSFKVTAIFDAGGKEVPAELRDKLADDKTAKEFLEALTKASFKVGAVEKKPGSRSPGAPFTTSTLQQEAARRLGFSVRQTMTLAQRLYENGHITYMRTDSVNLAGLAIDAAKKYITDSFGANYAQIRQYKTKSRGAQEAHEAIRPTHIGTLSAGDDSGQKKLYELIWRRSVASQMAPAKIEKTEVQISISTRPEKFIASGEILIFDGFLKVYGGGKDDKILPDLSEGQALKLKAAQALENFSRPPARYSEATLVRKLEELGIGRPSTYAPTISTIQDRGYIEKKDLDGEARRLREIRLEEGIIKEQTQEVISGAERAKLLPTELAEIVNDFLVKYFAAIVDYDFTAKAEEELDDIAEGKRVWQDMLKAFYGFFHPLVEKSAGASRAEAMKVREIGKDPKTGELVQARFGRFGPVLQMGNSSSSGEKDEPKPRFAPLPEGATIESVTLAQALPMFNFPRRVGETTDGKDITADIGPYGPYVKVEKQFISLKDKDPLTISEAEAREVIAAHTRAAANKTIADFGKLKILRGPYGPYVTNGKKNARIPKNTDPEKLAEAEAQKLLDDAPDKPKFLRRGKKS